MSDTNMNYYSHLHNIEHQKTNMFKINDPDFANVLHTNFNLLDSSEKKCYLNKILSDDAINQMLIQYDLENYVPNTEENMTLEIFAKKANEILKYYNFKLYLKVKFEDKEWSLHNNDSNKYDLKNSELIFDNSVKRIHKYDKDTKHFLENIVRILDKLSKNIEITYYTIDEKAHDIVWVLIKCSLVKK
jgi:hypothetical protein